MKKTNDSPVLFRCTSFNFEELIPKDVVDFFDIMDGGDLLFLLLLIASLAIQVL